LTSPRPRISPAPRRRSRPQPFFDEGGNELLLAFISTDYLSGTNTKVNSITGAGLTWVLVVRTNVQNVRRKSGEPSHRRRSPVSP